MKILDKKSDGVDVYEMHQKKEELKKYRERVLSRHKRLEMFYFLKTNNKNTIELLNTLEKVNVNLLYYNDPSTGKFSKISPMRNRTFYDKDIQQEILNNYIEGKFDNVNLVSVYDLIWDEDIECIMYDLLKTEKEKINHEGIWEVKNMLDLPDSLHLLHLLINGKTEMLVDKDIKRQLKLFEFEYLKTIKEKELKELIEFKEIKSDLENIYRKASSGSEVLRKARVRK